MKLGFGMMRLPRVEGTIATPHSDQRLENDIDLEHTKRMVDAFIEAGGKYFDTAYIYEGSEEATKAALCDRYPRESYYLADKLNGSDFAAKSEEEAKNEIRVSLERTGTGYIDFYLLHAAPETESSEVANEVVTNDTISKEMKETNMQEVQAYLKECGAFFIATADGDQPHVRPFGVSEIIDGRLYIMTGKVKDVYKQMAANGKFEICALKKSGSEWMRLSGTLVNDETLAVKEEFLNRNESLKSMYKADDENMAVLYITNATARFCSFSAPERKVGF